MTDPDFSIKQGDTSPSLEVQLYDGDEPIDELDQAVVGFRMQHQQNDISVSGLCAIDDTDTAEVTYIWSEGDTDVVGRYDAEFMLDYDIPENMTEFNADETFPSNGFIHIDVTETLE
jgi:hypothetical protein